MKYFTIDELTRSKTAAARGIDNTPTSEVAANLAALISDVLDPVRERWGRPIRVNSGYRSEALNQAVGGVATSQHRLGEAADITAGNEADNAQLIGLIRAMMAEGSIAVDQLIDEVHLTWIHVSHKTAGKNRGEILKL